MANIFTNPGAEVNTTGWLARGSATISRVTSGFHSGVASVQVVTTATATGVQVSNGALNLPGNTKTYGGYAWVNAPLGMNGRTFFSMVYSDSSTQNGSVSTWVGTGDWLQVVPPNITANGKTTTSFRIAVDNNEAVSRTFLVDDVFADETAPPMIGPVIVAGSSHPGPLRVGRYD